MTLRHAAYSAGRWTAASLLLRLVLQIAQTAVLARLLVPADFGLMAIAGAVYVTAAIFVDLGLSNALIHFGEPSSAALSTLYWLNLGASFLMMGIFTMLAWPLAGIYHEPRLLPVILTMSLAMPLAASGQLFLVLAQKRLLFYKLSMVETVSTIVGFALGVASALLGAGVYSLVVVTLASASSSSLMAWWTLSSGARPEFRFDIGSVVPFLRYGAYRVGDTLLNNMQLQADLLIGGLIAGTAAMGTYTVPRNLALRLANTFINPVVTRVGLPVMAKLKDDRTALKSVYLQTLRMTSSINFPVYASLAIWSNEVVGIVLGEQWNAASQFLRIFAAWGMIRSVSNPLGSLLYSTGRVKQAFRWNLVMIFLLPALLWGGASIGGIDGLAITMLVVQLAIFYPMYRLLVFPACGATFLEYASQLAPPFAAIVVASVVALASTLRFPSPWAFPLAMAIFGTTYVAVSAAINKPWMRAMLELASPLARLRRC